MKVIAGFALMLIGSQGPPFFLLKRSTRNG